MTRKKDSRKDTDRGPAEAELQTERDDLMARLQRVSADYQNYQKRIQRDIAQAQQFANEDLIKAMLTIIDDMERALEVALENRPQDDPLLEGMELVHNKLVETLGNFGLEAIQAEGRQFDPSEHLAMAQEESDAHAPLTVLKELQRGYKLRGRPIRPTAVVVSKEPEPEPDVEILDDE